VKIKGAGDQPIEGPIKAGRFGVNIDSGTVAVLRTYRAARGLLTPGIVRGLALVLSSPDGSHRHPERFSRRFTGPHAR
jgi:hypothetical protein